MLRNSLDINTWRIGLGFFPQTLFQKMQLREKYILLNGKDGNFCVDYTNEAPNNCRSYAWSSNVLHYLTIENDIVNIYRWDKPNHAESYPVKKVLDGLSLFNSYLGKQKPQYSGYDSIHTAVNIFRQIRADRRDKKGEDSLNALLCLFACYKDGVELHKLDRGKWGLSKSAIDFSQQVNSSIWNQLLNSLNHAPNGIKPNIELLLRHASGNIFQEAHYESVFPSQMVFPGFMQAAVKTKFTTTAFSSHYTPTAIVRSIVELVLGDFNLSNKKNITVFDPAVGSGEFLKEVLRQLRLKGYTGNVKLVGWDISPAAIDLARFSLAFEVQSESGSKVEIDLRVKDALTKGDDWNQKADIVLMNPPFISWELLSKDNQSSVSEILGGLYVKRPNLASAFFWKAANSLNPDGKIGSVLPAAILEGDSLLKLRKKINEILHVDFIGKLGSHEIFDEAIASSALFIASEKGTKNSTLLMWSDNSKDGYAGALRELRKMSYHLVPQISTERYSFYETTNLDEKNWTPIDFKAYQLINFKFSQMSKASTLFDIKQGVRTGLNKAFLIPKEFWLGLPLKEQGYFRPAVTNDSISYGKLEDSYYIFYAEGDYKINNETQLIKLLPKFYQRHFKNYVTELSGRARKSAENYWRLSEHRAWQLDFKPKIVSKEFGNAGAFAFDYSGQFVAERSNAWLPLNTDNWEQLGHAYVAVLSMSVVNELLKGLSKQILSGAFYLSGKFLNDMPIPDLFNPSFDKQLKKELVQLGKLMSEGKFTNDHRSKLEELAKFVYRA